MQQHQVKIKSIINVTHDVLQIITAKPDEYSFVPGQATDVSIMKAGWENEKRPFTFTCLPQDDFLQFTIKTYPLHKGVTNELLHLNIGDQLIVHEVFGDIAYKGEGIFIAGGAGITPFIAIIRSLAANHEIGNNKIIFANKTKNDIILNEEFEKIMGKNFINILSDEIAEGYAHGTITAEFIKENSDGLNKKFYLCGPPAMMEAITQQLAELKVESNAIIKESF